MLIRARALLRLGLAGGGEEFGTERYLHVRRGFGCLVPGAGVLVQPSCPTPSRPHRTLPAQCSSPVGLIHRESDRLPRRAAAIEASQ